jgi:hypothetical protein
MDVDETKYDIKFYVCDTQRIVTFHSRNIDMFPAIKTQLMSVYSGPFDDNPIFFSLAQGDKITVDTLDSLTVNGFAIINNLNGNKVISYLNGINSIIVKNILDVVTGTIHETKIWIRIYKNTWTQTLINFLIEYGFAKPHILEGDIYMKYIRPISRKVLVHKLKTMIRALESNRSVLKVWFSSKIAHLFATYIHKPFEVAGNLSIKEYNDQGTGILFFDEFNLLEGSKDTFVAPLAENAQLSFHTHPDICYKEFGCFLGWPSGQDMEVIPYNYLINKDILAHFVVSAEGIWVMHLTYDFQKILYQLKEKKSEKCGKMLIDAIGQKFRDIEIGRQYHHVSPLERHNTKKKYIDMVNNYKITNLAQDIPMLVL